MTPPAAARTARHGATDPAADDSPVADPLVTVLRACADPARLAILQLLARDAFGVQELGTILGLGQATVSHHLKSLVKARLVAARRDGVHTFYRRAMPADGPGAAVHAALLRELDARPVAAALDPGRRAVFEARAARSRDFFTRNAERFDAARELIAAPDAYLPELAQMLPMRGRTVLELGPGPGEFLPELATRFERVVAIDVSREMLERAQRRCDAEALDNVLLVRGELPDPARPVADASMAAALATALATPPDLIVCAMMLHHTPRPDALVERCAAHLAPGGQLFVAELCPHGQDWVFDACGDVWPGIDPDDLGAWARDAGLAAGPSQFLAQRNGFRIQLRRFDAPGATTASPDPAG